MLKQILHTMTALVLALSVVIVGSQPVLALSVGEFFSIDYSTEFSKTEVKPGEEFTITITGTATCSHDLEAPYNAATQARVIGRIVARGSDGSGIVLNPDYRLYLSPIPKKAGETASDSRVLALSFPAGTTPGTYQITGELIEGNVQAVVWLDVTSLLPASQSMGSVTVTGAGGGGGGGFSGGVTIGDNVTDLDLSQINLTEYLAANGSATYNFYLNSEGKDCTLYIPEGTVVNLPQGGPVSLSIEPVSSLQVSPPPQTYRLLGTAYRFGPAGATFNPPLQVSFKFDESLIPAGATAANLRIAWYDEATGTWQELESTVDPATSTVTARLSHFSIYSIIASMAPAEFEVSDLTAEPDELYVGEKTMVTATVTNIGDMPGSYSLQLLLNNRILNTEPFELGGGESQEVNYLVSIDKAGRYTISLGNRSVVVTVLEKIVEEPDEEPEPSGDSDDTEEPTANVTKPSPAAFSLSGLTLDRSTLRSGEKITVTVTVKNTGEQSGTYNLPLNVNNTIEDIQVVTLKGGEEQEIVFTLTGARQGEYELTVGDLKATFTVTPSVDNTKTIIYGAVLVIVVIAAIIVTAVLLIRRKKRAALSQEESL